MTQMTQNARCAASEARSTGHAKRASCAGRSAAGAVDRSAGESVYSV